MKTTQLTNDTIYRLEGELFRIDLDWAAIDREWKALDDARVALIATQNIQAMTPDCPDTMAPAIAAVEARIGSLSDSCDELTARRREIEDLLPMTK